jgi:hypothetical protein
MYDNYNYPPGADTPDAPWNEVSVPEREFDITVSETLSRTVTVCTDKYYPEYDDETGRTYANTFDTDWKEIYQEGNYTIPDLLNALKELLTEKIKTCPPHSLQYYKYKTLLRCCDGWTEDEYEVTED